MPIGQRKEPPTRRKPQQSRARATVDSILDAVVRLLKREGVDAVTTNRIARVAGVSIGTVYQYFPDKRAIFLALHDRHVADVERRIEAALVDHVALPLEDALRSLLNVLIDVHAQDPELYQLLLDEVPHRADSARHFDDRLRGALQLAISSRPLDRAPRRDLERTLFIVVQLFDALAHGAALRRPRGLSLAAAKEEALRAVMAYLRA